MFFIVISFAVQTCEYFLFRCPCKTRFYFKKRLITKVFVFLPVAPVVEKSSVLPSIFEGARSSAPVGFCLIFCRRLAIFLSLVIARSAVDILLLLSSIVVDHSPHDLGED